MTNVPDRFATSAGVPAPVLALALVLVVTGCGEEPRPPVLSGAPACSELILRPEKAARNVILIVNDTMRRDALGIYGGAAKTPHLDAFARDHLIFDDAVTQAPWTKPSIATLFTALYPSQHRVESHPPIRGHGDGGPDETLEADVLAPSLVTLAELLRDSGRRTAAVIGNPWLLSSFGFAQGFEHYDDSFARWQASGDAVFQAGLDWIDDLDDGEPFFLYLHTVDSHRPYGVLDGTDHAALRARFNAGTPLPAPADRAFAGVIRLSDGVRAAEAGLEPTESLVRAAYLRGVETFDDMLGRLLARLRADEALWQETAILITSDHGESLYERGVGNHGGSLYDEEAAVPLLARLPGVEPAQGRVDCLVGLVDVMPSLCSYLDVECPESAQGWSFLRRAGEKPSGDQRFLVTEGVMHQPDHRSIRNRYYKLLYEPMGRDAIDHEEELFTLIDLQADPRERFDRLETGVRTPEIEQTFRALRAQLGASVAALPAPRHEKVEIDAEIQDRLESLGYTE